MKFISMLFVLLLPLASNANSTKIRRPVLSSALTSKQEFLDQLSRLSISNFVSLRTSAICSDLDSCEEVTYYDDIYKIHTGPDFNGKLKEGSVGWGSFALFADNQLEIQSEVQQKNEAGRWTDDPEVKAFKKNKLLDPHGIRNAEENEIANDVSGFSAGKISASDFSRLILNLPKTFPELSDLLSQAREAGNAEAVTTLQDITEKALLLTLDALVPVANSNNDAYPYLDKLVPDNSLLPLNLLYQKLSAKGEWPKVVDLTPEMRKQLGPTYLEKTQSGQWMVSGFYNEGANQIALDLSNDFYENVYVYFHELWHVAWSHSTENRAQIDAVIALLNETDSGQNRKDLRASLLGAISLNEFLAIDQQVRLFHAMGIQTEDWANASIKSAMAWHDSYFGEKAYRLLIPGWNRKESFGVRHLDNLGFLIDISTFGAPLWWASFRDAISCVTNFLRQIDQSIELDDKYWASRLKTHSQVFENRYFGENLRQQVQFNSVNPMELVQGLGDQYVPELSCGNIARVRQALGDDWKFGFPFEHKISDPQNCPQEVFDPNHPSVEGSHADVNAFPSLVGPDSDPEK